MKRIEVFADVTCPFAHVGLRRFVAERDARGRSDIVLRVRAWPLELVNGRPELAADVAPKVQALRDSVARDLFRGFHAGTFPSTSLPALALEAEAHAMDAQVGEQFSLLVRTALFEDGLDVADATVLASLAPELSSKRGDAQRVLADWEEGKARNVTGSPHFFVDGEDFYCPSLRIERDGGSLEIEFDAAGFNAFLEQCLS